MDAEAMGMIRRTIPKVTPEDAGAVMVVGEDGNWTKGEVTDATISVVGHGLVITAAE